MAKKNRSNAGKQQTKKQESMTPEQAARQLPAIETTAAPVNAPEAVMINIDLIDRLPGNRSEDKFSPAALAELKHQIASQGLIHPLTVKRFGKARYTLACGERRLEACRQLGWEQVPAIIAAPNVSIEDLRLIENIGREDLGPRDESRQVLAVINSILDKSAPVNADGRTHQREDYEAAIAAASKRFGKSAHWVRERLMMADLGDDVWSLLEAGTITWLIARKLAIIQNDKDRAEAKQTILQRLRDTNFRGLPTPKEIDRLIGEHIYQLSDVRWELDVPYAGGPACSTCSFNSNNNPSLFTELSVDGRPVGIYRTGAMTSERTVYDAKPIPKGGVCSQGACYRAKAAAAKAAVDSIAGKAVTRLTREAEGVLGKKATPKKLAERALARATASNIAGLVPEGLRPAAVVARLKPKLERLAAGGSRVSSGTKSGAKSSESAKPSKASQAKMLAEQTASDEWETFIKTSLDANRAKLLEYFNQHLDRYLVLGVALCSRVINNLNLDWSPLNKETRRKIYGKDMLALFKIVAAEPGPAMEQMKKIYFPKFGFKTWEWPALTVDSYEAELHFSHREVELAFSDVLLEALGFSKAVEVPDEDAWVDKRVKELLADAEAKDLPDPTPPKKTVASPARKSTRHAGDDANTSDENSAGEES